MLENSGSLANSATQQHSSPINELSENVNSKEKQIANIKLLNEVSELQSYILLSITQIIQKDIDEPRSRESAILISNFRSLLVQIKQGVIELIGRPAIEATCSSNAGSNTIIIASTSGVSATANNSSTPKEPPIEQSLSTASHSPSNSSSNVI